MWFRQIAQLSTTMSQAQSATAFHCLGVSIVSPATYVVPRKSSYLLDLELLLSGAVSLLSRGRRVAHLDVGHIRGFGVVKLGGRGGTWLVKVGNRAMGSGRTEYFAGRSLRMDALLFRESRRVCNGEESVVDGSMFNGQGGEADLGRPHSAITTLEWVPALAGTRRYQVPHHLPCLRSFSPSSLDGHGTHTHGSWSFIRPI